MNECHTTCGRNQDSCSTNCCRCPGDPCSGKTLKQVIACYKQYYQPWKEPHLETCAELGRKGNLEKAIRVAATAHQCGLENVAGCLPHCKHPHQWRVPSKVLLSFARELLKNTIREQIEKAKNFKDIYDIVQTASDKISGIGRLAIYDTSLRIACALGKKTMSEKYFPAEVCVNTGSGPGRGLANFLKKNAAPNKEALFSVFKQNGLVPAEIENLLCICKAAM